jgi:hypothetical protein
VVTVVVVLEAAAVPAAAVEAAAVECEVVVCNYEFKQASIIAINFLLCFL